MADKIKRYDPVSIFVAERPFATMEQSTTGDYVRADDHQAAMREAESLLCKCLGALYVYGGGEGEAYKSVQAFLSAHQECGGGGE